MSEKNLPSVSVAGARATEQDVWNLYNLILRRDPEGRRAILANVGQPIHNIFFAMLKSDEFTNNVLPSLCAKSVGRRPYGGTQSLELLLTWAAETLPLGAEPIARLTQAKSWEAFENVLVRSQHVLDRVPSLRVADIQTASEQSALATAESIPATSPVSGDIEVANIWEVRGWCSNSSLPGTVVEVEILLDNELLGTARCDEFRRTVQERIGGDGHCGFTFVIPGAAQTSLSTERRLTVYEKSTRTAVGPQVLLRNELKHDVGTAAQLEIQLRGVRDKLAGLEHQLSLYRGGIAYPLYAYEEYAERFGRTDSNSAAENLPFISNFGFKPLITLVLAVTSASPRLVNTIKSIVEQTYPHWEAVVVADSDIADTQVEALLAPIGERRSADFVRSSADFDGALRASLACCKGDYMMFLQEGDVLEPDALYQNVLHLQERPFKIVYADEDSYWLDEFGVMRRHSPRLKPDFDVDYLLSDNYIGRFGLFERHSVEKAGGPGWGPAGTLDLLLRILADAQIGDVDHVPLILYHVDEQPLQSCDEGVDAAAQEGVCRAVAAYLERQGLRADVTPHSDELGHPRALATRVRWALPSRPPTVSLIIPTKDHAELIGPCLASILTTVGDYPGPVEVIALDNGTTERAVRALLRSLSKAGKIRLLEYAAPFDWSAMNNFAASQATGDVFVFLNNDVQAIGEGWLSELVSQALRPEVGAVGCRLLYEDDTIQHAGIVNTGAAGVTCHEGVGEPVTDGGYLGRAQLQRRASAVSGACFSTRREVFDRIGGFDLGVFAVAFSDIDYCFKVRSAGLGVVYTPVASLYHLESKSRGIGFNSGPNKRVAEEIEAFRHKWGALVAKDPFYNPHFERAAQPFRYLSTLRPS